ncbi:MAG: cupin domain-containing protein, partial [Archaeoglobaceae archaeon]
SLRDKMEELTKPFQPLEVATANDQVVRMALIKGEYHWHKHSGEDELFYVLSGELNIQTKDGDIILTEGEMAVIPRGVEHCPRSDNGCYVLMIEPEGLKSEGD